MRAVDEEVVQIRIFHLKGSCLPGWPAQLVGNGAGVVDEDAVAAAADKEGHVHISDAAAGEAVGITCPRHQPLTAFVQRAELHAQAEKLFIFPQAEGLVEGYISRRVSGVARGLSNVAHHRPVLPLLAKDLSSSAIVHSEPPRLALGPQAQSAARQGNPRAV